MSLISYLIFIPFKVLFIYYNFVISICFKELENAAASIADTLSSTGSPLASTTSAFLRSVQTDPAGEVVRVAEGLSGTTIALISSLTVSLLLISGFLVLGFLVYRVPG